MHTEVAKKRHLSIISMTLMLLTVTLATTIITIISSDNVFARSERYGNNDDAASQAAAVNNDCLNPLFDSNTLDNVVGVGNCGGTVSQQKESGQASAPITQQTANPVIELQRATTAQPPLIGTGGNCTACFDPLTAAQKSEYESILQDRSITVFGRSITTIEELCTLLRNIVLQGRDPIEAIEAATSLLEDVQGVSSGTVSNITTCLLRAVE